MHAVHQQQLGDALMTDFQVVQVPGDDAGHPAAGVEHGVGQHPHHPDMPTAIDQLDAAGRHATAQFPGRQVMLGAAAR